MPPAPAHISAAERAARRAGPVMNGSKAHSLWEIWMVGGGWGSGSDDKLPSLPVSWSFLLLCCCWGVVGGGGVGGRLEARLSGAALFALLRRVWIPSGAPGRRPPEEEFDDSPHQLLSVPVSGWTVASSNPWDVS